MERGVQGPGEAGPELHHQVCHAHHLSQAGGGVLQLTGRRVQAEGAGRGVRQGVQPDHHEHRQQAGTLRPIPGLLHFKKGAPVGPV